MVKESEKDTEDYLFKEMLKIGGEASKWECPQHRGKPDRICQFQGGLVVFVEVKSEGIKPEPHQIREHVRMRRRGHIVKVVDTKKQVDDLIDFYSKCQLVISNDKYIERD